MVGSCQFNQPAKSKIKTAADKYKQSISLGLLPLEAERLVSFFNVTLSTDNAIASAYCKKKREENEDGTGRSYQSYLSFETLTGSG